MPSTKERRRPTQAERRARTLDALLEAAARGLSRHGYASLRLERVASEAGYTTGALYHLFRSKEELALAVIDWVDKTWHAELGPHLRDMDDPVRALRALARGHAVFCRRDIARVMMTLRVEFGEQNQPVSDALNETVQRLVNEVGRLISAARGLGAIPDGPPPKVVALAYLGALEGVVISLRGRPSVDEDLAERAVLGVLGLHPTAPGDEGSSAASRP
jgi:AcrR family transcriptional regulator